MNEGLSNCFAEAVSIGIREQRRLREIPPSYRADARPASAWDSSKLRLLIDVKKGLSVVDRVD